MSDPAFRQRLKTVEREEGKAGSLNFLSDISRAQQAELRAAWPTLPVERRQRVLRELVELAELSVELDFNRVFQVALDDEDEQARATAVEGLWEDESMGLLRRLAEMLDRERSAVVRVAVVEALARYAMRAVMGELDDDWDERLRAMLLLVAEDEGAPLEERRRVIEAVAVYPDDQAVQAVIGTAYADRRLPMRASAIYAMGRNLDLCWLDNILNEMSSGEPVLRFEAARASGELGSQRAVPALLTMLEDPDREAQLAAVAALGKLGGRAAATALRKLLDSDDEPLRDAAEEALEELNFGANPLVAG